jgi:outer membrane receptor protein involved in Fe transport
MKSVLLQGVSAAAVLCLCSPAAAQRAEPAKREAMTRMVDELVVTAERREEALQDVPLAVSAFNAETLKAQRIDSGAGLQNAVPNVSFTRTLSGGYNFSVRGISGGVGVHVNSAPLGDGNRGGNRLADAEFYDVERIEVLRGPQGTLYGRNATSGVINVLTNKAQDRFSASLTGEFGNYDSRRFNGHVNLPVNDVLAIRVAGILLQHGGYATNELNRHAIDTRDLNAFRVSVGFKPTKRFGADLVFERFSEDDSRVRFNKQLCITDNGLSAVGTPTTGVVATNAYTRNYFSKGCDNGRITDPRALGQLNSAKTTGGALANLIGLASGNIFAGVMQNPDLRVYPTYYEPKYKASNDLYQVAAHYDLTDSLRLTSLTAFSEDTYSAEQDFNNMLVTSKYNSLTAVSPFNGVSTPITPSGVIVDPQLGAFDEFRVYAGYQGYTKTKFQEFRLQSDFSGPLNFNVGTSYGEVSSTLIYSVVSNSLTAYARYQAAVNLGNPNYVPIYVDPNPGLPPDGTGHNYYSNKTEDALKSKAVTGEAYYRFSDQLKVTLGGRYTVDDVSRLQYSIPLLVVGSTPPQPGGVRAVTNKKFTYRVSADWSPHLSFTDSTLLYGSVSTGYRNGGVNGDGTPVPVYRPETITAFEVGTRNTLLDGRGTINATAFYYNYADYQIGKALNRQAFIENVDATVKGVEVEMVLRPIRAISLNAQVGWLDTKITNGSSVDIFNPTNGDPNLEHVNTASGGGCVVPTALAVATQQAINVRAAALGPNPTFRQLATVSGSIAALCSSPQATGGVPISLAGRQLPQAPRWTIALGAQYTMDVNRDWTGTLRADYRWQSQIYSRVYNTESDIIDAYANVNATLTFKNKATDIDVQLFVKNLLNKDNITGMSLTDETGGFTRNIYLLDPRTYGISVTKRFGG